MNKRRGGVRSQPTEFEPLKVVALSEAKEEAREILDDVQYWEAVLLVRRLADFGDQQATSDLSIRKFRQFWELRIKGGFLKRINLRVYFGHVPERQEIVILMTYKKEEDRRTCPSIEETLEDRLEDYLDGNAQGASVFKRARPAE